MLSYKLKNNILALILILDCYLICDLTWIGLRFNRSDSLPFYVFISKKCGEIRKGMYISFIHPKAKSKIAKQVVGLPGDEIKIENEHVFVEGKDYGLILRKGRSNQALKPIQERYIPTGYVFVHAFHPESFDSRYDDFGLISVDQIVEELWPIF